MIIGVWREKPKSDYAYRKAKEEGYRCRSAYKLLQIQEKFKIIKPKSRVLDLGCAPGGWLQVATKITKPVFGIDLMRIDPMPGVVFVQQDFTDRDGVETFLKANNAPDKFDVIMSDMAPSNMADRFAYKCQALDLVEKAMTFAQDWLAPNGYFVAKVFEGHGTEDFLRESRKSMDLKLFKPQASRNESSEIFMICKIR